MIDAHFHIWRQADMPWLNGPDQPRIFGDYDALKRDYPIEEYLEDRAGTGIERSVYVQANWAPDKFEDEVAWVEAVAADHGWPSAIVAYADFTVDDVRPQLDRLSKYPLVRGVRQQLHWHENPAYRFAARPDLAADPKVRENIGRLADYDWSFDLQVFPPQMADAARLAAACPGVTFVLQHAGMLEDTSDEGWEAWREGMAALAAHSNVVAKLSAFGTFLRKNDPDFIAMMIGATVGVFGADRCLFGSNFPIEKLWTDFGSLFGAFRVAAAGLSMAEQDAIFNDTAARVYRL
jgi:predicted TIM-barrel fold metal-dependent hydrolase